MSGARRSPWPLALVLWAGTRSSVSTLGQRGCGLGGCYPSVWEGGYINLQPEQGGPWWGETAAWVRRNGWAVPSWGRPIPGPVAATHKGANLPGSCCRTHCPHKSCPAGTAGVASASQVESGAQVTAWKPHQHPQHHPVILVSSSWGPHAQAHCRRLRGVSGAWLLFPLVTRPQETKRDSVLVQFLFQQKVTLVRDGEKGAPA